MAICSVCGKEVTNEKFCPNCGSAIDKDNSSSNDNNKFCTNCGSEIDAKAEICPKCGVKQHSAEKTTKFCTNCGSEIDAKAEICPKCGVRQTSVFGSDSEKSVVLAIVLSLLMVGLGHFYLGLPKKGLLLIIITIVCWMLIFAVIGIILYPLVIIYGIYDVYKSAEAISQGQYVEDKLF